MATALGGAGQDSPLYSIGAMARLTGLPIQTLRNWERRYGLPRPVQNAPGAHRLYTAGEVALTRHLAEQVAAGVPIRKAVATVRAEGQSPAKLADSLAQAAQHLNAQATRRILAEASALLPPERVWRDVAAPALRVLGERWQDTGTGVAAEHLATDAVRGWLQTALDARDLHETEPLVAIACGPGERHELGSLMLSLLLRERGIRAIYLGADTPRIALHEATSLPGLRMLITTATTPETAAATVAALREVAAQLPPGTGPRIAYAGPGFTPAEPATGDEHAGVVYLGSDLDAVAATLSAQPSPRDTNA